MSDPGFNPRHGWHPGTGAPRAGGFYGFGFAAPEQAAAGFFPPPAGMAWVEVGNLPQQQWYYPAAWSFPQFQAQQAFYNSPPPEYDFPGANFQNGPDPGYNYIYPENHCKIHVLISKTAPWDNKGPLEQRCFNVPTGITVKELMQQFGCTNEDPKKNKLYEVTQGRDGRWYKGVTIAGDSDKVGKMIEEIGWNTQRNGVDRDFVWLYFTKD